MKKIGTKRQVFYNKAQQTSGKLKKSDLIKNKHGKIVSKKKSAKAKQKSNLGAYLHVKKRKVPKPRGNVRMLD